jgi:hypothetical protein
MLVDMARDIAGELQSNPKWQIEVARPQARLTTKHDQAGSSSLISGLSCRTEFSSDW